MCFSALFLGKKWQIPKRSIHDDMVMMADTNAIRRKQIIGSVVCIIEIQNKIERGDGVDCGKPGSDVTTCYLDELAGVLAILV